MNNINIPRPGEAELRQALHKFRDLTSDQQAATFLAELAGPREPMENDLLAFTRNTPIGEDCPEPVLRGPSYALMSATRMATRVFITRIRSNRATLRLLSDDDLVDEIYEHWFIATTEAISKIITQIARSNIWESEDEYPRAIEPMIASLAGRALTGTPSGWVPNTIQADSGSSRTSEANIIDAALPPHNIRRYASVRIRRLLSDIARHPEFDLHKEIAREISAPGRPSDPRILEEVINLTMGDISRKILSDLPVDQAKPSQLNLAKIVDGAGFFGWIRRTSLRVCRSKCRDATARRNRYLGTDFSESVLDQETRPTLGDVLGLHYSNLESFATYDQEAERLDDLLDGTPRGIEAQEEAEFGIDLLKAAGSEIERIIIGAAQLRQLLNIPEPQPALGAEARSQVAAYFREDTQLAIRSLKAYVDLVAGCATLDQESIPTDAILVWHRFPIAAARKLLGRDSQVVHTVASAAVLSLGLAKAPKTAQDRVLNILLHASGNPAWPQLASAITGSAKKIFKQQGDPGITDELLTAALNFPGAPLGTDRGEVERAIRQAFVQAIVQHRTAQVVTRDERILKG